MAPSSASSRSRSPSGSPSPGSGSIREAASTILTGAGEELALALQELRELARGLHPAILTNGGLAPALEALAERSSVPVELEVDPDLRLPDPVEVAIFYGSFLASLLAGCGLERRQ